MFLYEKKIVYLTFFWDGVKKSSAGFVKVSRERDACRLDIHIKHVDGISGGRYTLFLALRNGEEEWGNVTVKGGAVDEERSLPVYRGKFRLGEKEIDENELCGVVIRFGNDQWVSGYWQETKAPLRQAQIQVQTQARDQAQTQVQTQVRMPHNRPSHNRPEEDLRHVEINEKLPSQPVKEEKDNLLTHALGDKWGQLQRAYKKVHPFGDERLYLAIEPRDFIVLQAPYQRLVNNSFLLHGYYNYRHLILGPDEEIGTGDRVCFYLGVPGTYFEREKMVAVMFGFEGFECAGPVEVGKFGYYMRRVEL